MQRLLGLDVGEVRIGVALSDPLGITAQPHSFVARKECDAKVAVRDLVAEHDAAKVIVGYPKTLEDDIGPAAQAVDRFIAELETVLDVPVIRWDERLTTAQAQRVLLAADVSRKNRKKSVDKMAAAIILQSYLDSQPGGM